VNDPGVLLASRAHAAKIHQTDAGGDGQRAVRFAAICFRSQVGRHPLLGVRRRPQGAFAEPAVDGPHRAVSRTGLPARIAGWHRAGRRTGSAGTAEAVVVEGPATGAAPGSESDSVAEPAVPGGVHGFRSALLARSSRDARVANQSKGNVGRDRRHFASAGRPRDGKHCRVWPRTLQRGDAAWLGGGDG